MASTYLTRTPSQAGSTTKGTFSAWVKRGNVSTGYPRLFHETPSSNNYLEIFFSNGDELQVDCTFNSSVRAAVRTNRKFRDPNSFYHIMISIDSTQSTASDRIKFYVNGVQETSFAATTYPGSGDNMKINGSTGTVYIGQSGANSEYFDGSMSHVHWIDGTAYTPSAFGETDATTGEWKAKTSPSVTYGTNGFLILKDGNTITDQSSNSNNFTLGGGTLIDLKDNPDNVFATMNPLQNLPSANTYSQGNNTVTYTVHNHRAEATLGMTSGKYYWEQKYISATGGSNAMIGVGNENVHRSAYIGADATGWSYYAVSGVKYHNGANSAYGDAFTTGDIIGVAFDADTRTIWFSKNGTWQNSATISEIGAGTTTNSAYTGMGSAGDLFLPATSGYNGNVISWNFGNGYFGTTAITTNSGNGYSGAEGSSKFNYTVPTGYSALSTKGLNE